MCISPDILLLQCLIPRYYKKKSCLTLLIKDLQLSYKTFVCDLLTIDKECLIFRAGMSKLFHKGPVWLQVFVPTSQEHTVWPINFLKTEISWLNESGLVCCCLAGTKTWIHTGPLWSSLDMPALECYPLAILSFFIDKLEGKCSCNVVFCFETSKMHLHWVKTRLFLSIKVHSGPCGCFSCSWNFKYVLWLKGIWCHHYNSLMQ